MQKKIDRLVALLLASILILFSAPLQEISKIDFSSVFNSLASAFEEAINPYHDITLGDMRVVEMNIGNEKRTGDSLYTQNVTLGIGDSETIYVDVYDEEGNPTNDHPAIQWSAYPADAVELRVREDTKYCDFTILETTAVQVTISAHLWGKTNKTVIDISNNEVRFTSSDYYILIGSDKLITSFNEGISASAIWTKDREGTGSQTIQDTDFTFTSSDPTVFSVDNNNNSHTMGSISSDKVSYRLNPSVYGIKEGKATLTIRTASDAAASCTVTVVALKEYKIEAYSEDLETPLSDATIMCNYDSGSLRTNSQANIKTGSDGVAIITIPDVDACPSYQIKGLADFHPLSSIDSKQMLSTDITRFNMKSNVVIPGVKTDSSNISALSTEVGEDVMTDLINFDAKFEFCDKVEVKLSVDMEERKLKGTIKVSLDKTDCKITKDHGNSNAVKEEHEKFKTLFKGFNENKSEQLWKDLRGKAKSGNAKFGIDADLALVGYVEFDFSQGKMQFSEGGILAKAELKLSKDIYTSVPAVFVAFKLSGSVEAGLNLHKTAAIGVYDGLGISFTMAFEIGASVGLGVGCDIAKVTVGVEGKLKLAITLASDKELTLENMLKITAKLSGFFEWKVELWVLKFGNKHSIDIVEAELYPNLSASFAWETKSLEENSFEQIPRDYLFDDELFTNNISGEYSLSNVYPNGAPQIVTLSDGKKLAVWLTDDGSKTSINRTTLVYSVCSNGQWSNAEVVSETGRYDGTPILVSDGAGAHLLWLRGAKVFDDSATFDEFKENIELVYSKFSDSTWSSPITVKANNGKYPLYFSLAAQNGNATVSWTENEDNNVFLNSGITSVYQRDMNNGIWNSASIVTQTEKLLNSISSGYIYGNPKVACSIDTDGDILTTGDNRIFIDGNAVTPDDGSDYMGVSYENGKFYFSSGHNLCSYNGSFAKTDLELSSSYKIIGNGKQLAVVMLNQSGYTGELMISYSNDGVNFTNPIYLTDYGHNISDYDVIMNPDGSITYCIDLCYVNNKKFGHTDFLINTFSGFTEVSMSDAVYDMDLYADIKNTIFECTVSNDGTTTIDGFDLNLLDKDNNILVSKTYNQALLSGEKVNAQLSYDIPTYYDGSNLKLAIVPQKDTDLTNNEFVFNFGYSDLTVENAAISSNGTITATVTNRGYKSSENTKVSIYLFDGEDVLITEIPLGSIARGASSNINYKVDASLLESDSYIYYRSFKVEASGDGVELNYGNDSRSVLYAPTRVEGISLSARAVSLAIGDTTTVSSNVLPQNATDKRVYWFTSNDDVVSVSPDGKVTGVGFGTATVKAITTDGHFEDTCTVTVSETVSVTGIEMQQTNATVLEGQTRQLSVTITPENATNKSLIWSSDNTEIATVNANGLVTAKKDGSAIITAKTVDGNYQAFCVVTVTKVTVSVTGISISDSDLSVEMGKTKQLSAVITPANATNYNVNWSSDNPNIVSVNSSGLITAKKAGTANITASTVDGGFKATCQVTVTAPVMHVTGINVSPSKLNLNVGEKSTLSAEVFPVNATDKTVIWESGNNDVASVSSSGLVTAVSEGTTVITATTNDGNHIAWCEVNVGEFAPPVVARSIAIKNHKSSIEIDYRTTVIFTAETVNLPDGAIIQWFKNDVLVETGEKCTVKEAADDYYIQAKILQNGKFIAESKKETVKVKKGFFARLIAFFKGLFRRLPIIEQ